MRCTGPASAVVLIACSAGLGSGSLVVASKGAPPRIHSPGENEAAGARLAERIATFTGIKASVNGEQSPPEGEGLPVSLGTPQTNTIIRDLLGADVSDLGDEGYILRIAQHAG